MCEHKTKGVRASWLDVGGRSSNGFGKDNPEKKEGDLLELLEDFTLGTGSLIDSNSG